MGFSGIGKDRQTNCISSVTYLRRCGDELLQIYRSWAHYNMYHVKVTPKTILAMMAYLRIQREGVYRSWVPVSLHVSRIVLRNHRRYSRVPSLCASPWYRWLAIAILLSQTAVTLMSWGASISDSRGCYRRLTSVWYSVLVPTLPIHMKATLVLHAILLSRWWL